MILLKLLKNFCKKVQNEKDLNIISVRSDHGGEFENSSFKYFLKKMGYHTIFLVLELLNKMV